MDVVHHLGDCRFAVVDLRATTVIRLECDQCDHHIGRSGGNWFGLDHAQLDDDGQLIEPAIDHQYHFCSKDCVITWLMNRSYDMNQSEGGDE